MNRKILTDFILTCKRHAGYKALAEETSKLKTILGEQVKEDFIEDSVKNSKLSEFDSGLDAADVIMREIKMLENAGGLWASRLSSGMTLASWTIAAIAVASKDPVLKLEENLTIKPTTVYLHKEVYGSAADGDKARLIEVLENYEDEHGARPYREMVKKDIHSKTLQSIAMELVERRSKGTPVPPVIEKALKITEDYRAKVRSN